MASHGEGGRTTDLRQPCRFQLSVERRGAVGTELRALVWRGAVVRSDSWVRK